MYAWLPIPGKVTKNGRQVMGHYDHLVPPPPYNHDYSCLIDKVQDWLKLYGLYTRTTEVLRESLYCGGYSLENADEASKMWMQGTMRADVGGMLQDNPHTRAAIISGICLMLSEQPDATDMDFSLILQHFAQSYSANDLRKYRERWGLWRDGRADQPTPWTIDCTTGLYVY